MQFYLYLKLNTKKYAYYLSSVLYNKEKQSRLRYQIKQNNGMTLSMKIKRDKYRKSASSHPVLCILVQDQKNNGTSVTNCTRVLFALCGQFYIAINSSYSTYHDLFIHSLVFISVVILIEFQYSVSERQHSICF